MDFLPFVAHNSDVICKKEVSQVPRISCQCSRLFIRPSCRRFFEEFVFLELPVVLSLPLGAFVVEHSPGDQQ